MTIETGGFVRLFSNPTPTIAIRYLTKIGQPEFQTCFYDICVYFKDWSPVIPYPCFGDETFPEAGKDHCLDFIDHDYEKRDRLEVILFCYDGDAVCIYRDKCSHYGVRDTDIEPDGYTGTSSRSSSSSLSTLGSNQLNVLNGTNFYVYGTQQALRRTK
jgi:hypothetical protein